MLQTNTYVQNPYIHSRTRKREQEGKAGKKRENDTLLQANMFIRKPDLMLQADMYMFCT